MIATRLVCSEPTPSHACQTVIIVFVSQSAVPATNRKLPLTPLSGVKPHGGKGEGGVCHVCACVCVWVGVGVCEWGGVACVCVCVCVCDVCVCVCV